ncbi:hypothetical protein [Streptomyces flavalbus]|uniref:DUF3040 domain-containing protein n=1 Tax=Streptomyces flavalbus TaxID=2665155 RepID=A0ABW2W903_9ACTN
MTHRDTTPSHGTSPDRTEQELQESLAALAGAVHPMPDAYRTARGEWLRRERRRRVILTVLVAVVFAVAVLIGLWVLNRTPSDPGVIFSGTGTGTSTATAPSARPPGSQGP